MPGESGVNILITPAESSLDFALESTRSQSFPDLTVAIVGQAEAKNIRSKYICSMTSNHRLSPTFIEKCVFLLETLGLDVCTSWHDSPGGVVQPITFSEEDLACYAVVHRRSSSGSTGHIIAEALVRSEAELSKSTAAVGSQKEFTGAASAYSRLLVSAEPQDISVLIAMPYLTMGGAEAIVSQICQHLGRSDFRLFIVTTVPILECQSDATSWFEAAAAGIYHLPRFLDPSLWPAFLCYLLEQHRIRVIWQIGSTYVYGLMPLIRHLFPSIGIVDLLFNASGHTANHFKFNSHIDHVVTEYEGLRTWLIENGDSPDKVSVIPNGVDLERYAPTPRTSDRQTFVVGFFGRLSEEKDPGLFIDIAACLAERHDIEFVIGGAGPLESELRAAISDRGLRGRVRFLGVVTTSEVLPSVDVVVVCSRLDGRPNIVMEGLAAGVPVVASRVGGIPDMVPESSGGILCEPGDSAAFVRAIEMLADQRGVWAEHSSAARAYAEVHFSVHRARAMYVSLFRDLAARRKVFRGRPDSAAIAAALGLGKMPSRSEAVVRQVYAAVRFAGLLMSPARLQTNYRNLRLLATVRRNPRAARGLAENFDAGYYQRSNPDVAESGIPPFWHYILAGYLEGRNPSRQFDTRAYLARNPEAARSGVNALLHYVARMDGDAIK